MSEKKNQMWRDLDTRVRELVLTFKELQADKAQLKAQLAEAHANVRQLEAQLAESKADYRRLMTARMLEIGDVDHRDAKRELNRLIREVDQCIALLATSK
ncbi:MAG: hypothetical protein Q4A44_04585 [Bacteroidales bacterium]|nr:hypothetical protein [Bacteroidales bacterium]